MDSADLIEVYQMNIAGNSITLLNHCFCSLCEVEKDFSFYTVISCRIDFAESIQFLNPQQVKAKYVLEEKAHGTSE